MIGNEVFQSFELLGIDTGELKKLDGDFDSIQARINKAEAELALLRPSEDDFDTVSEKLEAKIKGYRSQLGSLAESISQALDHLQAQVKVNPRQYVEPDLDKIKDLDKLTLGQLFMARETLRERGEATDKLQEKLDILKGLGAEISDAENAWNDRWTSWELQWPAYVNRHALLFAGGRGVEGAWDLFSNGAV
jgi:chromosome segregation ATPase